MRSAPPGLPPHAPHATHVTHATLPAPPFAEPPFAHAAEPAPAPAAGYAGRPEPTRPPAPPALSEPAPFWPQRLLAGVDDRGRLRLAEHLQVHGPRPTPGLEGTRPTAREILRAVADVDLRGRGGGGYPLGAKLSEVARRKGRKVVVVNGAESEPAALKDATLLHRAPHLVLDGAALAAELVGADEVVVWLHRDPDAPGHPVELAVAERVEAELDGVAFRVEYGPARYVAGESSAIVNHLSGGPALPTLSPPHATERGVNGRPTVLSNAETLAQLALLARHGPGWYRSAGTPNEPGTLLVTVTGAVHRAAVLEVPFGTPVYEVVRAAVPAGPPQAVLVGGYAGTWLPWERAAELPLSRRDLAAAGAALGVGLVAVLPDGRCGLDETAHVVDWLAGETAGQCGPCVNGLPAIAGAFRALTEGRADIDTVDRLVRWTGMVQHRGLCHHPDGVVMLVRSALLAFEYELRAHLAGRCLSAPVRMPPLLPLPARRKELAR